MTVIKAVYDGNKFDGVIGIDVSLANVSEMMNGIKIGKKGYPVLMDANLKTMTHKNPDIIGSDLPIETIAAAMKANQSGAVDYQWEEDDGLKDKFAVFGTVPVTGWRILATMYEDEIEEETAKILQNILFVWYFSLSYSVCWQHGYSPNTFQRMSIPSFLEWNL